MGIYFSLKSSITTGFSQQNTVDKIQDIRIEQIKHDVDLQGQKIEQMDQMYNNNYSKNK
jgi:hypothetical protein